MRRTALFCLLGLLFGAPTDAQADDVPKGGVRLAAEDLELVPLTETKKRLLFLRHAALVGPLGWRARESAKTRASSSRGERRHASRA